MNPSETVLDRTDTKAHIGAENLVLAAMQLLPSGEAEAVRRHVKACPACQQEMGRICVDLATLAITSSEEKPDPGSRERLLAQVSLEKKTVAGPKPVAAPPSIPEPALRPLADFGRGRGTTLLPQPDEIPSRDRAPERWIGWAIAAAFALIAIFLYIDARTLSEKLASQAAEMERLNERAAESHQLLDALTDPGASRAMLAPKGSLPKPIRGPRGDITYNPEKGALVFLVGNLDPLQVYKTYQLWLVPADGKAPVPAGTFHPDEHGNASVVMPNIPKGIVTKGFEVTIEDAGGTEKPSGPIVLTTS